jgi:hypothetical protein
LRWFPFLGGGLIVFILGKSLGTGLVNGHPGDLGVFRHWDSFIDLFVLAEMVEQRKF